MSEFTAFDPNAEVMGKAIQSTIVAIGDEARDILAKHGFDKIELEAWYSQQKWLDAFKELSTTDSFNMVAVGMKLPDTAEFPPKGTPVEKILSSINTIYHHHHRNGDVGELIFEMTGEREGVLTARRPYPSDFDYGLLYRILQKYRPVDSQDFSVVRAKSPTRKNGDGPLYIYAEMVI